MNTISVCVRLLLFVASLVAVQCYAGPTPGAYSVAGMDGDSRTWQDGAGHQVTEIATGMNYFDSASQQWVKSDASFTAMPGGIGFAAQKMQHQVTLSANLNAVGAVTAVTPDGITLNSTPVAIGLYDAASGKSVTVASLTNSPGVLLDPQHVFYQGALTGDLLQADVTYSLPDCGSFHQDIVISRFSGPINPVAFGFPATSTNTIWIQFFTEFYGNVPAPQEIEKPIYVEQDPAKRASMASPDLVNYALTFGDHYTFGPGRAYASSTNSGPDATGGIPTRGVRVGKQWVTNGTPTRTFLVESVPYSWLKSSLDALPPVGTALNNAGPPHSAKNLAAVRRERVTSPKAVPAALQYASIPRAGGGGRSATMTAQEGDSRGALALRNEKNVNIDYIITINGAYTNVTYTNGNTYFVSGPVYVQNATIQDSVAFKYPKPGAPVDVENTLDVQATSSQDLSIIFTAADDNALGHGAQLSTNIWTNYTGTVSGHYADPALQLETYSTMTASNLSFWYAQIGLCIDINTGGGDVSIFNSLLTNCVEGIDIIDYGSGTDLSASETVTVTNTMLLDVRYPFNMGDVPLSGTAIGCTFTTNGTIANGGESLPTKAFWLLTNCTLTSVTNLTNSYAAVYVTVEGSQIIDSTNVAGMFGGTLLCANLATPAQSMETVGFVTGNFLALTPQYSSGNGLGRGVAIYSNYVYYTDDGQTDPIHVAPFESDGSIGNEITNAHYPILNPGTNGGIQGLAFYGGYLYALSSYGTTNSPKVFKLDPSTGALQSGYPITVSGGPGGTPNPDCDGFAILTNGDFLINDDDGADNSFTYREYSRTNGSYVRDVLDSSKFGWHGCTGVVYDPNTTNLFFAVHSFTGASVIATNLATRATNTSPSSPSLLQCEQITVPLP